MLYFELWIVASELICAWALTPKKPCEIIDLEAYRCTKQRRYSRK